MTPATRGDLVCVDSSVVFKWFCADEECRIAEAQELYTLHTQGSVTLVAPAHLPAEVLNALAGRPHVTAKLLAVAAEGLAEAEIVYPAWDAGLLSAAAKLARAHRMTFYDALFPALAIELGCELVTANRTQARVHECPVHVLL